MNWAPLQAAFFVEPLMWHMLLFVCSAAGSPSVHLLWPWYSLYARKVSLMAFHQASCFVSLA